MAKICIDPGHGGSDPGAVKYIVERDVNLAMALACRDYLNANGVSTKLSRTNNSTGTSINSMAREANSWGADRLFQSTTTPGVGTDLRSITLSVAVKAKYWRRTSKPKSKRSGRTHAG